MFRKTSTFTLFVVLTFTAAVATAQYDWRSGIPWQTPPVVTPGANPGDPPSDAIILFDGTDMSEWNREWAIEGNELVSVPGSGSITTNRRFGSIQLHLEFKIPADVTGTNQARGNSGVFIGPYEIQILDGYNHTTYYDGKCASIYKQTPPIVNASRPPGEWQRFNIIFNRPDLKIEDGRVYVIRPGYITVFHNGVLVVNRHQLLGSTSFNRPPRYEAHEPMLPITLQEHGSSRRNNNIIRFRNIWVREIPDTNVRPEPTRDPFFL